jgi:hypothetical protein
MALIADKFSAIRPRMLASGAFLHLWGSRIQVFRRLSDTEYGAGTPFLTQYPWPGTAKEAKMSLRVDKPQAQGRWREGQLSWDMGHQKKKQQKNQGQDDDTPGQDAEGGPLYNAKGDLVPFPLP